MRHMKQNWRKVLQKLSAHASRMKPGSRAFLIMIFVPVTFVLGGCPSKHVSNCAGFRENALSPAGTVALAQADRPGLERVAANDANYQRLGCP